LEPYDTHIYSLYHIYQWFLRDTNLYHTPRISKMSFAATWTLKLFTGLV
jgi:hypothetical protein